MNQYSELALTLPFEVGQPCSHLKRSLSDTIFGPNSIHKDMEDEVDREISASVIDLPSSSIKVLVSAIELT